ncbi:MAG: DUF3644 domain-containing protein [Anaerolineae bacterium]
MRREAKLLLNKAIESLTLSVELFNRPYGVGREAGVLILLDHSLEMLLKSAIVHRGGRIQEKGSNETIGFKKCVAKARDEGALRFVSPDQAVLLNSINGLRDAAQHYLIETSEHVLYVHIQAGVTLFDDILSAAMATRLVKHLPRRVLPVSTTPPTDLVALFSSEVEEVGKLLRPGARQHTHAMARVRALAILENAADGQTGQPSRGQLNGIVRQIRNDVDWSEVFPYLASVEITTTGSGPSLELRMTKREGVPVHDVPPDTPGVPIATRRVAEQDYYSLGHKQLAQRVGLTPPKLTAVIRSCGLADDPDCAKVFRFGKSSHQRYSPKAIARVTEVLAETPVETIWTEYRARQTARRQQA